MIDPALESVIRARVGASPFARWMGIELVGVSEGTSEITMPLAEHHLNPGGIVHGGIIATMLDAAIGIALRTRLPSDRTHVTVNLHVNYLAPVREGLLRACGRAVRSGDRVGFGEADLLDPSERLLARGSATFLVIPIPDDRPGA